MTLTPDLLVSAYCQGIFPMAHGDGQIHWYDPDPRAVLPLESFHMPRSLQRTIKHNRFEVRYSTAFEQVMRACGAPAPGRTTTWISEEFVQVYTLLHRYGLAHSVEAWRNGVLVGGLYGVAIRGLFAGESMFSRETDASKVALAALVMRLRERGFQLLDVQFQTPHLARFGVVEIPRLLYKRRLRRALAVEAAFV
ncbi:MAG: leucyl/phenylalanyl-tRNA--protein transferase [Anaerolineales bacterium]|nr:leucyl/phenylalanyl-tRNA--protein transferase [Anaerolineales bacterium]